MNIGITGINGFIGSSVNKYLSNESIIPLNVYNEKKLDKKLDWVLHFGASKDIATSFSNPLKIFKENINSTINAINIAINSNARFLYMSSYVYGEPQYLPIDELHPAEILNPYMGSKLTCEHICLQIHKLTSLTIIILRGFTIFGPLQKDNQFISSIIKSIKNDETIIVNDPTACRDYLFIDDFLSLINKIIYSNFQGFDIFNVGSGKEYNNRHIVETITSEINVKVIYKNIIRKNDISRCVANINKISDFFNWTPKIDIISGMKKCLMFDDNR